MAYQPLFGGLALLVGSLGAVSFASLFSLSGLFGFSLPLLAFVGRLLLLVSSCAEAMARFLL